MFAPILTEEWFKTCLERDLCVFTAIGKYNAKNCRGEFSKTIPKTLRDEGWNAFLIIKNHKERWKYMGFNVTNTAGALTLTSTPDILWSGYVFHGKSWYAVTTEHLIAGRIPHSSSIILPQIEFDEDSL